MTNGGPEDISDRLKKSRLLQILGGYIAVGFGALQVVDMFVERLPVPDWLFVAVLVLLLIGGVVIAATAMMQERGPGHWLTWRRTVVAGAGSFGVLVLAVGTFMGMRAFGIGPLGSLLAAGVIEHSERILLSDFQSQTGDTLLAGAVTEAFRVDFEQSRIISLVEPGQVRNALLRMQRPPDARLEPSLAREVAQREGIKALLTGEINTAGRTFIVSARLVTADTDSVLVSLRETARDSSAIIAAIDRLSSRMRERIGESLVSIRASDRLEQVTTGSLPALRKYSQAVRALELEADAARGIPLLEEAVALDSMFAMAHRKLGVAYSNLGWPRENWEPAYRRAYELSDRLTDRERYYAHAAYYSYVLNDADRAMATYHTLIESYPKETAALNNLALLYTGRGDRAKAVDLYRRAAGIDPNRPLYYTNLMGSLTTLGEVDEARAIFADFERRFPEHPQLTIYRAAFAYLAHDMPAVESYYRQLAASSNQQQRAAGESGLGSLSLLGGRIGAGRQQILRAIDLVPMPQQLKQLRRTLLDVQIAMDVRADTAASVRMVEQALRVGSLLELDGTGALLLDAASFYTVVGRPQQAREIVTQYDRLPISPEVRSAARDLRRSVDARLLIAAGDRERGLAELRALGEENPCPPCADITLGAVYESLGMADSAIVRFEKYVDSPWLFRLEADAQNLPRTHERLGYLLAAHGNAERAIYHLARFTELWSGADADLQPRVEAARRQIASLRRGTG